MVRAAATWLHRHSELAILPIVLLVMASAGFAFSIDLPSFLLLLLAALATVRWSFRHWPGPQSGAALHARIGLQAFALMLVTYVTGWGAALSLVFVYVVAENVRESGSQVARLAFDWSLFAIAIAQLGVQLKVLPSSIALPAGHGVALVGALILGLLVGRIHLMTERKEHAEELARAGERRFRSLVAHSNDVIVVIGDDTRITYVSASAEAVLGYREDELVGRRFHELVHPDDRARVASATARMLETPDERVLVECRFRRGDGSWITIESNSQNLTDDPDVGGFVVNTRDVSDRKSLEAQLQHRAFHDALTGLANRHLFRDRLDHAVTRAQRSPSTFAVLFLDLDGFKIVNDTLGHQTGDELLKAVAARLRLAVRDMDTAARLGGDEFAVLLEDLGDRSDAARVAQRILSQLHAPIEVGGSSVQIGASIGIVIADGDPLRETAFDPVSTDVLLRNADIAMYTAKSSGKGRYEIFEPAMHAAVIDRLELEGDLRQALQQRQFELHYQPIVTLGDSRMIGVEALLRWHHPERGMISPGTFIPVAEETGLIVPIGSWVLKEAVRQIADWTRRYPESAPLALSVNVSARQLTHGDLSGDVRAALAASGLDPAQLVLEITESGLMQDIETTSTVLQAVKALGVRIAIDDFGTGYSSLSYLQHFPLDILKIDRTFVDGLVRGTQSPALVGAIIDLGRSLHLATVAEGIETDEQLSRFRELHCRYGQGFLFARPAPAAEIEAQVAARAGGSRRPDPADRTVTRRP